MYLIFDTETTGLPKRFDAPLEDLDNWPRLVQLAWQLHGSKGELLSTGNFIVKPEGFTIPFNAEKVHGISTDRAIKEGHPLEEVLAKFEVDLKRTDRVIGHNIEFDLNVVGAEFLRKELETVMLGITPIDTKDEATEFCAIPGGRGGKFKWPTLTELHQKLFGEGFADAHDAAYDVDATAKCFFGLITNEVIVPLGEIPCADVIYEAPKLAEANFAKQSKSDGGLTVDKQAAKNIDAPFAHLHVHTQYTILNATCEVKSLIAKAREDNMPAVAMTDQGNMMGAFKFVTEALKAGLKPVVGCEFFVAEERTKLRFTKDNPDRRFNQVLIAKNRKGYENLIMLSSIAYTEGLYGIYPRIDKELIEQYKDNVIALTGGLSGEIPNLILNVGEHQAEDAFKYWHGLFGDDFYVELIRHGLPEEDRVNEVLLGFAKKYGVKAIAANDVYYLTKEDAKAHDVLLCVKDGEKITTPIGRGRGKRFGFTNQEYYFKSQQEMKELFTEHPEAIENITEILDKIEEFQLSRDVLLPKFDIPEEFIDPKDDEDGGNRGENAFLRHLTYEGAKKRYPEITDEIRERLDFELSVIENTGYPGYFLIVQDFTTEARKMGVSVGPGRGSAAGSAVAYCIGITNVDPIAYDLLFERFLNPDRVSMPDIDIDFDDEGREKVLQYVVDKYGYNQVSHIITYGTMAAKSSIRDCARVMDLDLTQANELAKLIPEKPGITLDKAFREVSQLKNEMLGSGLRSEVLKQAVKLEGSIRNTGIHACGVIITPDDLRKFVPVAVAKDAPLVVTQFDNSVVENAGLLKMDFLGLKTLTIIKTACRYVKERHGVEIIPDDLPLDDPKTYELYQKGQTNGTFQFESAGMQKYLRELKPDRFEDLIAMNALYRPGPLEYIPNFVARKHGREPVNYDLPEMEEYLGETYGITVYQEQVMLLSQSLAGFTKGQADALRKGMGKKKKEILDELQPKFYEGGMERGHPKDKLEKIWKDWEAFAAYAFNKSHSTCYSVVAYHTAYLKAHYPAEYMAAVLTHNQSNIDKVTFFMEECRSLGIKVLGPDVNESGVDFMVNKQGEIRFGLGAIKGTGEAAVESIIEERKENGAFKDIFDFAQRVDLRSVNRKTFEVLARSGAFDCLGEFHRRQYLEPDESGQTLSEKVIKYAQKLQQESSSAQASLFGGESGVDVPKPRVAPIEPFSTFEQLNIERDVVGLYITGHPLDQFKLEINSFCNSTLGDMKDLERLRQKGEVTAAGIVTDVAHKTTKNGRPFGILNLEDYNESHTFYLFGEDYMKFKPFLTKDWFLFLRGKVGTRWKGEELEFKIMEMELLAEIREKIAKKILMEITPSLVDGDFIAALEDTATRYPGNCPLQVTIRDEELGYNIPLYSRKFLVSPDTALLKVLGELSEDKCKILT
ncbi:DNA polymerase III subunit alpha [Roseivirga sp. BDSF3-8]|uniref:DNA polymerase III subunit alpha n=1 Tax=Roseivirga sp. BDSF3-8 TaxID=3241598 RepID=UPI0035319CDE